MCPLQSWRPFGEFLNSKRVSMPSGVGYVSVALVCSVLTRQLLLCSGVKDRIFKNVPYFLTNYLMVLVVLTLLTLLMAPMMAVLISMPLLVYWYLFVWRADLQYTVPVIGYAGKSGRLSFARRFAMCCVDSRTDMFAVRRSYQWVIARSMWQSDWLRRWCFCLPRRI